MSILTIPDGDVPKCGLGRGSECCAFLTFGLSGWMCGRTIPGIAAAIRARLDAGTIRAKYDPGEVPYPECQKYPKEGI